MSGNDKGSSQRRCPRCGGPLERNSGGAGDSVIFAASPPGELCEPCLTGHSPGWIPPAPEPEGRFGRVLLRNPMSRWLRDRRDRREAAFVERHDADVLRMKQNGA
jgi:hypothetical protein